MRDKFIVGAGDAYNPEDEGGSDNHNHTASAPAHTHYRSQDSGCAGGGTVYPAVDGIGGSATPAITVVEASSLPPYLALAYIMRIL